MRSGKRADLRVLTARPIRNRGQPVRVELTSSTDDCGHEWTARRTRPWRRSCTESVARLMAHETLSVEDEHRALLVEQADLKAAQAYLEKHPDDIPGHEVHKLRLRAHIEKLHAHVRRIHEGLYWR